MQINLIKNILSYTLIISLTKCSAKLHFEKLEYEGDYYNGRGVIQFEDIKLYEAGDNLTVRLQPAIAQFEPVIFDTTANVKSIQFKPAYEHADDFTEVTKIFDLEAYENGDLANKIVTKIKVHVHFKTVDKSLISFDKFYYNGTFNNTDFKLKLNETITFHLDDSIKHEQLYLNIEEYAARVWFKPELTPDKNIILNFRREIPINDDQEIIVFTLSVQAGNTIAYAKFAMVVIYENIKKYDMEFVKHEPVVELYRDELPWKFNFKAISKLPDDVIRYGFYSRIKYPSFVSINPITGEFTVDAGPSTDVFLVEVFADSSKLHLILLTRLAIVVKAREEQRLQEKAPYSLVVRHVLEDQKDESPRDYKILLPRPTFPGQDKEYAYCLVSTYPETPLEGDRFVIVDGGVYSKKLLRETDYFQDMKEPHFTVTVKMIQYSSLAPSGWCHDRPKTINPQSNDVTVIPNTDLLTTITVVVDDVNNNAPHIEEDRRTVCYPKQDLLPYIQPPYLTRVQATDKDSIESGYGKITYAAGLGTDYYLQVDAETGIVYPTDKIYSRVGTNVVRALDSGYYYDDIYITHRIIGVEHIAVLNLTEVQIENVENYLKSISTKDFIVRPLDIGKFYVLLPSTKPSTRGYTRTLNVVVYCLKTIKTGKDEEQVEMTVLEMQPFFKKLDIEMKPFEIKNQNTNSRSMTRTSSNDNTLFITMSLLGVIVCIGFWM